MPAGLVAQTRYMQHDSKSAYGWISIFLHWSTAILIIALWFIGKSIMAAAGEFADDRRGLHISLAATAWLLILFRIGWRIREGHPHVRGQTMRIHTIAKYTHYASLAAVAVMLLSGPVIVWARGYPVNVFDLFSIPSPIDPSDTLANGLFRVHATAATFLMLLIVVHVGGALKHLMFHNDDTIIRMIWPGRQDQGETKT
mgnify:FL=1